MKTAIKNLSQLGLGNIKFYMKLNISIINIDFTELA